MRNWLIPVSALAVIFLFGMILSFGLGQARGPAGSRGPSPAASPSSQLPSAVSASETSTSEKLRFGDPSSEASAPEDRGPNGRPIEPVPEGRELKEAGLPERPDAVPPAASPEVWAARREEQDAGWRRAVLTTTEAWAGSEGLTDQEREATLAALENMHGALAQIREEMLDGRLGRREGREGMARIRREARESLVKSLGENRVEGLLAALSELPGGGF